MQSRNLVLGIGNESKETLSFLEREFSDWDFAVIDCWSNVQEVKAVEEEQSNDLVIRFVHDLSYYISEPQVQVRFGAMKYNDAETQKVISYLPHYIDLLQKAKQTYFSDVIKALEQYNDIIIASPTDDGIAATWLFHLTKTLQTRRIIRIFSWYPLLLEGQLKTDLAASVSESLMDTEVQHYCFFRDEIVANNRNASMKVVFSEIERTKKETLRCLLLNQPIQMKQVVVL